MDTFLKYLLILIFMIKINNKNITTRKLANSLLLLNRAKMDNTKGSDCPTSELLDWLKFVRPCLSTTALVPHTTEPTREAVRTSRRNVYKPSTKNWRGGLFQRAPPPHPVFNLPTA